MIREARGGGSLEYLQEMREAYDRDGRWVGGIREILVDERGRPEYISLAGGSPEEEVFLVPVEKTSAREDPGVLRIAEGRERVLGGPPLREQRISPEYENRLRSYYGLEPRRRRETPSAGRKAGAGETSARQPPRQAPGHRVSPVEESSRETESSAAQALLFLVVVVLALAVVYEAVSRFGWSRGRKTDEDYGSPRRR